MYASLLHQQLLQFAQQGVGSLGGDLSPSVSDRASSREDSPTVKSEFIIPLLPVLCHFNRPMFVWLTTRAVHAPVAIVSQNTTGKNLSRVV